MQQCREHIVISSEMKLLSMVRSFLQKIIHKGNFPPDYENRLVLAVDEAVSNIIEHAYGSCAGGYIDILAELDKKKISFIITDSGRSFNPSAVKKPIIMELIKKGKKRGLGIFLMRQIMDEVKYTFKCGQNQVCLIKYLKK